MKNLILAMFVSIGFLSFGSAHADVVDVNFTTDGNGFSIWNGSSWDQEVQAFTANSVEGTLTVNNTSLPLYISVYGNALATFQANFTDMTTGGTFMLNDTNSLIANTYLPYDGALVPPESNPIDLTITNVIDGGPYPDFLVNGDDFGYIETNLGVNDPSNSGPLATPEPASLWLFAFAGVLLLFFNRKNMIRVP